MLVLTRKQQESIKIGDSITITILRVQGHAVRVGIEAPRDVRVVRGELLASTQEPAAGEDSTEPQVVQFRFAADRSNDDDRTKARGPLAALMATLHTPGMVTATASK